MGKQRIMHCLACNKTCLHRTYQAGPNWIVKCYNCNHIKHKINSYTPVNSIWE